MRKHRADSAAKKTFSSRRALPMLPVNYPTEYERPLTRGDCVNGPRPCPWVSCKHHLFLDVTEAGNLTLNFPDKEPHEIAPSCVLDVADEGGKKLEYIGDRMNVCRERVRQIVEDGLIVLGPVLAKFRGTLEE